jgi:hypothetical protein
MLSTILVLALFCLVFYAVLLGIDIIWKRFKLFPSQYRAEKQDCIANYALTSVDYTDFHLASHHAVAACELNISGVCTEATANVEGLTEGIQLILENAGEHIASIL